MGSGAGTGEALPWAIASDVPSTSPRHRTNSGAHGEAYSMHQSGVWAVALAPVAVNVLCATQHRHMVEAWG